MNNKDHSKLRLLTLSGLLISLTTIFTAYIFHFPVGTNGGYIHFGDAVIYLAAALLPTPYAMAVGAIGGGLADLLTAPMWTGATVIIKMLITIPFTCKSDTLICKRNIIAPIISLFISSIGYYYAEAILFGTKAAFINAIFGSHIQSIGSAIFFYMGAIALDRIRIKRTMFQD
ncbi:MAG: TIGR04002 family protein [Lachnospiraceae bacterium]|nr:TIGR04002 family protein [Lachnospiraceae bacterium]